MARLGKRERAQARLEQAAKDAAKFRSMHVPLDPHFRIRLSTDRTMPVGRPSRDWSYIGANAKRINRRDKVRHVPH